jgi:hypothetical protein
MYFIAKKKNVLDDIDHVQEIACPRLVDCCLPVGRWLVGRFLCFLVGALDGLPNEEERECLLVVGFFVGWEVVGGLGAREGLLVVGCGDVGEHNQISQARHPYTH